MDDYQTFIHRSRYARFLPNEGRRENIDETIDRYFDFLERNLPIDIDLSNTKNLVKSLDVVPSMRAMMTAGSAAERDNTCIYNCAYLAIDEPSAFDEAMFILLCGTGVGFSVERQYINQLPEVPEKLAKSDTTIVVEDCKEGWARALRQLISLLYSGEIPKYDTSKIRPAGSELKTFGGRASGPEPLIDLFEFVIHVFKQAAGGKLNSLQAFDIMCKIGEIVVVGGVRRSAMICLSNLSDDRMRHAKSGAWWEHSPHRALANISWCATETPEVDTFMQEWLSLYQSKSGERGIFNREGARKIAERTGRQTNSNGQPIDFGTNPCSEIILRNKQFCNLTEVIARSGDLLEDLEEKVVAATILGTIQSTFTYFPYLSRQWKENSEEERLLGVSITGIMDNPELLVHQPDGVLDHLRGLVRETNQWLAAKLGINESAATTAIKPSGTVSQLVDSASGIHPRYAHQYARTVRADNKDPMTAFLKDQGVPHEPDFMKPDNTTVFTFLQTSPANSITRDEFTAVEQLELWKTYQQHWCEHKPSMTVYVREHEWPRVGAWIWDNFDLVSGISFLPYCEHAYRQAPYQDVDDQEWAEIEAQMPRYIDWAQLARYERGDTTAGSQSMACSGDSCEVVDLTG